MNYTSIEQSKKLLELGLSVKTADMVYLKYADSDNPAPRFDGCAPIILMDIPIDEIDCETLPCWSLGALLEMIPDKIEYVGSECDLSLAKDWISYEGYGTYDASYTVQPMIFKDKPLVDLLFESIIWLLENGYIKKEE